MYSSNFYYSKKFIFILFCAISIFSSTFAKIPFLEAIKEKPFHGISFHMRLINSTESDIASDSDVNLSMHIKMTKDADIEKDKEVIEYTLNPHLQNLNYENITELFKEERSLGFAWDIEDIGCVIFFWDGSVQFDGKEDSERSALKKQNSQKPSLSFDLLGRFVARNANFSDLKINAYDTHFFDYNTIDHVCILGSNTDEDHTVFINSRCTLSTSSIISDLHIVNKGTLSFKDGGRLHVKNKNLKNNSYGCIEGDGSLVMDQMNQFLNERMGKVNVPFLRLHANNTYNTGKINLKKSFIKTDCLINDAHIKSEDTFIFEGQDINNSGSLRVNHADIQCDEEFLNEGDVQIVEGKIMAMHHLNLGTHMWGGTLNHDMPQYKQKKRRNKQKIYRKSVGRGLENHGLYIVEDQNSLLTIKGPLITNDGDFIVPSLDVHIDNWTNTSNIDISNQMKGYIGSLKNTGTMNVRRDLTTRGKVTPPTAIPLTSREDKRNKLCPYTVYSPRIITNSAMLDNSEDFLKSKTGYPFSSTPHTQLIEEICDEALLFCEKQKNFLQEQENQSEIFDTQEICKNIEKFKALYLQWRELAKDPQTLNKQTCIFVLFKNTGLLEMNVEQCKKARDKRKAFRIIDLLSEQEDFFNRIKRKINFLTTHLEFSSGPYVKSHIENLNQDQLPTEPKIEEGDATITTNSNQMLIKTLTKECVITFDKFWIGKNANVRIEMPDNDSSLSIYYRASTEYFILNSVYHPRGHINFYHQHGGRGLIADERMMHDGGVYIPKEKRLYPQNLPNYLSKS